MSHDPLCLADPATDNSRCHYCVLIAKVREDERTRNQGQSVMLASDVEAAMAAAREDMLAKCIAAVLSIKPSRSHEECCMCGTDDAVAALRALQEKP